MDDNKKRIARIIGESLGCLCEEGCRDLYRWENCQYCLGKFEDAAERIVKELEKQK